LARARTDPPEANHSPSDWINRPPRSKIKVRDEMMMRVMLYEVAQITLVHLAKGLGNEGLREPGTRCGLA
jgi:hypothetical protein